MTKKHAIVSFKSNPLFFHKERIGIKPNTIRRIDESDERFKKLREGVSVIQIVNTDDCQSFVAMITDYSEWAGFGIISWKHPEDEDMPKDQIIITDRKDNWVRK